MVRAQKVILRHNILGHGRDDVLVVVKEHVRVGGVLDQRQHQLRERDLQHQHVGPTTVAFEMRSVRDGELAELRQNVLELARQHVAIEVAQPDDDVAAPLVLQLHVRQWRKDDFLHNLQHVVHGVLVFRHRPEGREAEVAHVVVRHAAEASKRADEQGPRVLVPLRDGHDLLHERGDHLHALRPVDDPLEDRQGVAALGDRVGPCQDLPH
mmetsp:Transcript_81630/g.228949  ORF Transcript_81630/g.228949 Transcript_81630/m.228949 type:complete len:210 (+) Transcript_81630:1347-1976(+)